GHLVRSEFEKGGGVPCLLAIHQNPSGKAREIGLAWARGIGGAGRGVIETTFRDECAADLFGEHALLCGGPLAVIKARFGTPAKGWRAEYEGGMKNFKRLYEADNNHPVEVTGRKLRKMMPWLKAKEPPKG